MTTEEPAKPAPVEIEYIEVHVQTELQEYREHKDVSGYELSEDGTVLHIKRRDLIVAIYRNPRRVSVLLKFTDGSWIDEDSAGAPPTDVGMGVTVSAVGGRTA